MAAYGVTQDGFTIKGIDVIISESLDRARQAFGADIDLTPTSPLRKILEMTAQEDAALWQYMENLYYSNFISTTIGNNLDLLGGDLGSQRLPLFAQGQVTFKVNNAIAGRQYTFPLGTILVTADPTLSFGTLAQLTLTADQPQGTVNVQALQRGPKSNIASNQITGIQSAYQDAYLTLGGATVQITQGQTFTGGDAFETDDVYRTRLLGLPRNLWTLDSVSSAVLAVDGVKDVGLSDPLGGVDASQNYFNQFKFAERHFSGERKVGETYSFDIVVAHDPVWPWLTLGGVTGIQNRVRAAVDPVRPIGVHPNIIEATLVEIGVRASLLAEPGSDAQGLLAAIKQRIATEVGMFQLGDEVRFSQVMRAFTEQPGVIDVQNMHLRRYPVASNQGPPDAAQSQAGVIEAPLGANLVLRSYESPVFQMDSALIAIEVKSS